MRTNSICTNQNLFWKMRNKLLWDFEIQTDHLISAKSTKKRELAKL